MTEQLNRIRAALVGITIADIHPTRMGEIFEGRRLPTSLEYALIAEASGVTVDWLLHGKDRTVALVECRAAEYVNLKDTCLGSALCGCEDCCEYVAERESEDEV